MRPWIAGTGWVTPLGSGVSEVWERLLGGESAQAEAMTNDGGRISYQTFKVPASALSGLPLHPRLRRASAISRFAAAAGLAAMEDAKKSGSVVDGSRLALIFAISNGGVIYTRRFYDDIVVSGPGSASPILFPETVFNAPASHLAAILGIAGLTYTLVGDGSVGLSALNMAGMLLAHGSADACLVVGAEEVDWLLCDAYARWRLLKPHGTTSPKGMILSEGAGAVVVAGAGSVRVEQSEAAVHYEHRRQLPGRLFTLLKRMPLAGESMIIGSANGTFVDAAESTVLAKLAPGRPYYTPKGGLGESVGASGLWQVIAAVKGLQCGRFPEWPNGQMPNESLRSFDARNALVISCGLNQGVSALQLAI